MSIYGTIEPLKQPIVFIFFSSRFSFLIACMYRKYPINSLTEKRSHLKYFSIYLINTKNTISIILCNRWQTIDTTSLSNKLHWRKENAKNLKLPELILLQKQASYTNTHFDWASEKIKKNKPNNTIIYNKPVFCIFRLHKPNRMHFLPSAHNLCRSVHFWLGSTYIGGEGVCEIFQSDLS